MLFKGGKKTGKGNAQGVEAGDKLAALENSLRIRQQVVRRGHSGEFRSKFHCRPHLRRARGIPHHSRKLPRNGLGLRGRWFHNKGRKASCQDQGPQNSELPLLHVCYLPGAALAAVLNSCGAFTVKSAVREMV